MGFSHFSFFLRRFILAELATSSSIRINEYKGLLRLNGASLMTPEKITLFFLGQLEVITLIVSYQNNYCFDCEQFVLMGYL